jgi:hypothetical protein
MSDMKELPRYYIYSLEDFAVNIGPQIVFNAPVEQPKMDQVAVAKEWLPRRLLNVELLSSYTRRDAVATH